MSSEFNRRQLLVLGGASGLAFALAGSAPAWAAPAITDAASGSAASGTGPRIRDLGPGVVQFPLMSGLLVGDTMYVGSRNLQPPRVVGFHLPTRTVTSRTDLASGYSIQALAADPVRNTLVIGVLRDTMDGASVYEWDLSHPETPAVPIGATGDRDVRALAVAPDGKVYVAGGGDPANPPSLWEVDPATGTVTSWGIPDAGATIAQAVAATESTVYFGTGSVLAGGDGASPAKLWAFDRTTRTAVDVLPAEFAAAVSVTSLSVLDGTLGVGLKGPGKSVLLDRANPSTYEVIARTGVLFRQHGDTVYFAKDPTIFAYSLTTKKMTQVQDSDIGTQWGLDVYGDQVVTASSYSSIAEIDPRSRTATVTDLVAAGAPAGPQTAMGIAVGAGNVYVGGTGAVARLELATGTVTNLRTPGEQKDGVVVEGVLYSGQYNSKGIWSYDPTTGLDPSQVAALPANQNRPLDVCWDPVHRLVLVAAQNDTQGGGSFTAYDPATGTTASWVNPIDARQMVRAVTTSGGIAYLGGDNLSTTGPRSTVVAWDPIAGSELWRVEPGIGAGIAALATVGDRIFGLARHAAGVFVIDIPTRSVVRILDVAALSTDFGAMTVSRGLVYAVSDTTVFRIDPQTLEVATVVAGIDGAWYSGPHIEADENGLLYTMQGLNLVEIDDGPFVDVEVVAESRCIGSKPYVVIRVTNAEPVPVSLRIRSDHGERTFAEVLPGRNAVHSFAVRATSVAAGSVTVEATRAADGSTITARRTASYAAAACG